MTFEQWMRDKLTNCGMFPDQVDVVIARVKAAPENEVMAQRWHDKIGDYRHPDPMVNVLWFTTKRHALEYIDAECPKAWFRPMFVSESESAE